MKKTVRSLRNSRLSRSLFGAVILLCLITGFLSCAEERPLAPGPVSWQAYVGYTSYGRDTTGKPHTYSFVYVWDLDSVAIVDSLPLPVACQSMVASHDGESVFLLMGDEQGMPTISRMSTPGWQQEWRTAPLARDYEWPYGDLYQLKGGTWLRYNREIVRAADGQIIKNIPDSLHPLGGPIDRAEIAVGRPAGLQDYTAIRRYDLLSDSLWGLYSPHLLTGESTVGTTKGVLHPDGERVLTFAIDGAQRTWFLVGDLNSGETLLQDQLDFPPSPRSEIIVTPDGGTAIVSNVETLDVYDLHSATKIRRFTASDFRFEITGDPSPIFGHVSLYGDQSAFLVGAGASWYHFGFLHAVSFTPLERIATVSGPLWEYAVALNGFTVVPALK